LEDLGKVESIILKMDLKDWGVGGVDWIDVAQDKDRQRAFVNVVMNVGSIKCGEFLD
jgi:hypothetical protein